MNSHNPQPETCTKIERQSWQLDYVKRRLSRFRILIWMVAILFETTFLESGQAAETVDKFFRIGFTSGMFTDVNENDARAAVKVLSQTLARERGIPTNPEPLIFKDRTTLLDALRGQNTDVVGLMMTEYAALTNSVRFAPIFVTYIGGRTTVEYVLLVHQSSQIESVADLQGRSLVFYQNPRACLAPLWLDILLAEKGFPKSARYVGKITQQSKLSNVVLPVFFRKVDACVVTRTSFNTMVELNSQVGKQLRIIASSTNFVPSIFAFREDYNPSFKEKLLASLRDLHKRPTGQQVLTIFQSEKMEDHPASCLDSALELIATHARLCSETNTSETSSMEINRSIQKIYEREN